MITRVEKNYIPITYPQKAQNIDINEPQKNVIYKLSFRKNPNIPLSSRLKNMILESKHTVQIIK